MEERCCCHREIWASQLPCRTAACALPPVEPSCSWLVLPSSESGCGFLPPCDIFQGCIRSTPSSKSCSGLTSTSDSREESAGHWVQQGLADQAGSSAPSLYYPCLLARDQRHMMRSGDQRDRKGRLAACPRRTETGLAVSALHSDHQWQVHHSSRAWTLPHHPGDTSGSHLVPESGSKFWISP